LPTNRSYRFYWRTRSIIAPTLENAQAVYERFLRHVCSSRKSWLELGCGHRLLPRWRSNAEAALVRQSPFIVGVDFEHGSLVKHGTIRRRVRGDALMLPFADETFDLVTANMVLEHLAQPASQLREVYRVLRPEGIFVAHTPNVLGYSVILARLIPEALKATLVRVLQGRLPEDVFRTYYRINSATAFETVGRQAGFAEVTVQQLVTDAQLIVFPPLVIPELLLIRLLMTRPFKRFRTNLIAVLRKG